MKTNMRQIRLVASCPDQIGIQARVADLIAKQGGNITTSHQYTDKRHQQFFMRYSIEYDATHTKFDNYQAAFEGLGVTLDMQWRLVDTSRKKRVVFLVSKFDHCLAYLLHRWKVRDLSIDIPCVISNHEALRPLVEWYGIPYHYVPVPREPDLKHAAFENTANFIRDAKPDTIVLARYMQIFPSWLCSEYTHKVINIHHSFLPSFIGAKPYHQADERGVKLIGATCHYVTADLDAGPIIEQDVVRVHHSDSIEDMMRRGKDVENTVLARGLRLHLEDRVIVNGHKTILFTN